jgi:hypothetical protein
MWSDKKRVNPQAKDGRLNSNQPSTVVAIGATLHNAPYKRESTMCVLVQDITPNGLIYGCINTCASNSLSKISPFSENAAKFSQP